MQHSLQLRSLSRALLLGQRSASVRAPGEGWDDCHRFEPMQMALSVGLCM
jgi:hypothetical protein